MNNLHHYNRKRAKAKRQAKKKSGVVVVTYNANTLEGVEERFTTYEQARAYCDNINAQKNNVKAYIKYLEG